MDGSLVFVARRAVVLGRRARGDTRSFYFFWRVFLMVVVGDDESAELPRLGCVCV